MYILGKYLSKVWIFGQQIDVLEQCVEKWKRHAYGYIHAWTVTYLETLYTKSCVIIKMIFFLLFSCNLIFSRFLQFLWFMNPFIKWCWEGRGRRKPLLQYSLLCMKCIKALFLAFLPMALGRSASQFIFKIYVSWCSFALFSCVFETKNKGNSSSFVMPFLQLINHHSSPQDQLSSCF